MKIKLNKLTAMGMDRLDGLMRELKEMEIDTTVSFKDEQLKRGEIYELLTDKYAKGSSQEPQITIGIKKEKKCTT